MFQKTIEIQNRHSCRENLLTLYNTSTENRLASRIATIDGSFLFEGKVNENHFRLRPIVEHRSIFLPIIEGTVQENESGSQITAKLSLSVRVLILLWLLTALFIAIGFPVAHFQPIMIFLPFLLLIILWGISAICFKAERKEAENLLRSLFEESTENE